MRNVGVLVVEYADVSVGAFAEYGDVSRLGRRLGEIGVDLTLRYTRGYFPELCVSGRANIGRVGRGLLARIGGIGYYPFQSGSESPPRQSTERGQNGHQ